MQSQTSFGRRTRETHKRKRKMSVDWEFGSDSHLRDIYRKSWKTHPFWSLNAFFGFSLKIIKFNGILTEWVVEKIWNFSKCLNFERKFLEFIQFSTKIPVKKHFSVKLFIELTNKRFSASFNPAAYTVNATTLFQFRLSYAAF